MTLTHSTSASREQGGEVIGVNTETLDGNADNIATAKKILESAGASFRNIYFDPNGEAGKFALGIMAFPHYLCCGPSGQHRRGADHGRHRSGGQHGYAGKAD